jgi:protein O-mannosyl-transferase
MRSRGRVGQAALLLTLVLVTYSNSFSGGFEGDSGPIVTQDPRVQHASRDNFGLVFSQQYWYPTADSGVYRPMVTLSWMFNYVLLGNRDRAAGYHVVNLALHMATVLLAWRLALEVWTTPMAAFFTAAIFALHPVNSEAVTNVAGRADLMAALGVLAALLLHARPMRASGWRSVLRPAGILAATLFGVFSKENAVVVPAVMLLYDVVIRRERSFPWRRVLPAYAATTSGVIVMLMVRHSVLSSLPSPDVPFVDNPLVGAGFWTARLTALEVIWRYVGLLVWPQRLSWDYSYNQIPMATMAGGLASLAGIVSVLAVLVWLARRHPAASFFGAFSFVALLPVSNLLFFIGTIMAERLLYLPSLGFSGCLVAVLGLGWSGSSLARSRILAVACLAVIVGALGLRTWQRNFDWTDGEKLWASAVDVSPNSFKTHLAVVYGLSRQGLNLGNINDALDEARKAVSIVDGLPLLEKPTSALTTLGTLYKVKGDLLVYRDPAVVDGWHRKALQALSQALPIDRAYAQERRRRELTRGWSSERIEVKGYAPLYEAMSETYRALGLRLEAIDALQYLIRLSPLDANRYANIAELEWSTGHAEDSVVSLWMAEAVNGSPEWESRLAAAYGQIDPGGCARASTSAPTPNRDCPQVRAHICAAHRRLVAVLSETGHADAASRYRVEAVRIYGCTAS